MNKKTNDSSFQLTQIPKARIQISSKIELYNYRITTIYRAEYFSNASQFTLSHSITDSEKLDRLMQLFETKSGKKQKNNSCAIGKYVLITNKKKYN
jgi:hypothetical protein